MDANGIRCLVDLLTLAHLHTSRATVPTQVRMFHCLTKQYALILGIVSITPICPCTNTFGSQYK